MAIFILEPNGVILNGIAVIKPPEIPNSYNFVLDMPGRVPHLTTLSPPENAADAKFLGDEWFDKSSILALPADASGLFGANTAAVITYAAAGAGKCHVIYGITFGYNGTPTGGAIQIEDGSGNVVFYDVVTAAGAGFIPFDNGLRGSPNTALIITLAAGGSGVRGAVSVKGHRTE